MGFPSSGQNRDAIGMNRDAIGMIENSDINIVTYRDMNIIYIDFTT